eukprot:TRINITY_DN2900_c0_g1_i31.p1 TRINITY_DN2900_c0_g1~~TRINITY_DN2900_c0_g1_i31.p1  ORF type:complete len:238 (-),score=44.72 TRINITY_DN2900_c0_g1_i31:843-1517(-)
MGNPEFERMSDKFNEVIVLLQGMFPSVDRATIRSALTSQKGNVERAIDFLLEVAEKQEAEEKENETQRSSDYLGGNRPADMNEDLDIDGFLNFDPAIARQGSSRPPFEESKFPLKEKKPSLSYHEHQNIQDSYRHERARADSESCFPSSLFHRKKAESSTAHSKSGKQSIVDDIHDPFVGWEYRKEQIPRKQLISSSNPTNTQVSNPFSYSKNENPFVHDSFFQ